MSMAHGSCPSRFGLPIYDTTDASTQWENARHTRKAPSSWRSFTGDAKTSITNTNIDEALADFLSEVMAKKCAKDYGLGCVLVLHVRPLLTTIDDMKEFIASVQVPERHPFDDIFVTGDFRGGSSCGAGYGCWRLLRDV